MTKFTCVFQYDTIFRLVSFSLMHANEKKKTKIVLPVCCTFEFDVICISVLVTVFLLLPSCMCTEGD